MPDWEIPDHETYDLADRSSRHVVVIPVLDEGERILRQLGRLQTVTSMPDIMIADGGSTDGSMELDRLASLGVTQLLVKTGPGRLGAQERIAFASALKRGYDGIIRMDGNDKDGEDGVAEIAAALDRGFDFVQGSRFIAGGTEENTPRVRRIAIRAIHAPVISLIAGDRFTDTTNAFRGHSRAYLEHPEVQPFRDIFQSYELLAYLSVRASQLGLRACEVPVSRSYPIGEVPTKISHVRGNTELLRTLWRLRAGDFDPAPSTAATPS